uniref:Uncharacterized protein n=1 Tax=Arundo donax TaxID=35708 RepID=A0A0A9G4F3_ARUDO
MNILSRYNHLCISCPQRKIHIFLKNTVKVGTYNW